MISFHIPQIFLLAIMKESKCMKWLIIQEDLDALYCMLDRNGKVLVDVCLWAEGVKKVEGECADSSCKKCKRVPSPVLSTKCAKKEREIEELTRELKELHRSQHNFSDPQYLLWAQMICNGIYSSKDVSR